MSVDGCGVVSYGYIVIESTGIVLPIEEIRLRAGQIHFEGRLKVYSGEVHIPGGQQLVTIFDPSGGEVAKYFINFDASVARGREGEPPTMLYVILPVQFMSMTPRGTNPELGGISGGL